MLEIVCPFCGTEKKMNYWGQDTDFKNLYGTFCLSCGGFIPPEGEVQLVKDNLKKDDILREVVINKIKRRLSGDL